EAQRVGADLAAGKLAGDASLPIDTAMIALDPGLRSMHEFLRHKLEVERGGPRPEGAQRFGTFGIQRLVETKGVVQAIAPGQRLDDQRKAKPDMRRLRGPRIEAAPGRHRSSLPLRQGLEACLIEKVLNEIGFGDDKAECLGQPLALARDQKRLRVLLIEQHRRLALRRAEVEERVKERFAPASVIVPGEAWAGMARIKR